MSGDPPAGGTGSDADVDSGSDTGDGGAPGTFDPVEFLERAVGVASNEDVGEMRALLVDTLADHGVRATVDDAGNTLASRGAPAAEAGTHLVLNTHVDTVSPHVPVSRAGGRIHGRGACDAKGPLAVLLAAFLAVDPGDDRVTLAVTPDEEALSTGAAALDIDADLYVVGEPTGLDVCHAGKGRFQATVRLSGTAAHAAEPDSGANAIAALEGVLGAVRRFDAGRDPHPDLGPATLTPTVVDGGASTNQVPAACALTVDRRPLPPETAEGFRDALARDCRRAVPDDVGVEVALTDRPTPFLEAFETDPDHGLVGTLAGAVADVRPGAGAVRPFRAACEASYFAPAPVVVFGPGVLADDEGAVAHADREYVEVADVLDGAAALGAAVDELVGG